MVQMADLGQVVAASNFLMFVIKHMEYQTGGA